MQEALPEPVALQGHLLLCIVQREGDNLLRSPGTDKPPGGAGLLQSSQGGFVPDLSTCPTRPIRPTGACLLVRLVEVELKVSTYVRKRDEQHSVRVCRRVGATRQAIKPLVIQLVRGDSRVVAGGPDA